MITGILAPGPVAGAVLGPRAVAGAVLRAGHCGWARRRWLARGGGRFGGWRLGRRMEIRRWASLVPLGRHQLRPANDLPELRTMASSAPDDRSPPRAIMRCSS